MPTLFVLFGLRFYFYSDEHLPIHIHVENADGKAKFNVAQEIALVYNKGLKRKDLKLTEKIIMKIKKSSSHAGMNIMVNKLLFVWKQ